ncbi:MAG: Rieske 2Fe-2S domain-containing protein [Myxococcota bacterium]
MMIEGEQRISPARRPEFPFPVPVGWFRVAFAGDLKPCDVKPIHYFGHELVLVCTETGSIQVFDAHCPHLGAHLGHGGRVVGETLRCPFHAWRFGVDGVCVETPYADKIPPKARLRAWPTEVQSGIVWVWHHPHAEPPTWEAPRIPEVDDPGWTPLRHHHWTIRTCIQEIAENTSDPAHFAAVHGFVGGPTPEISFDGHRYRSLTLSQVPHRDGELMKSRLEVTWDGLGLGLVRSSGAVDLMVVGTNTPIDTETVHSAFSFSVCEARGFDPNAGAGKAFIGEAIRQMEQDIPIWENKAFMARPVLSDGDGPIGRYRNWANQFYLS